MATITLHDVPDEILNRLERRAQAHGRSLNSEMVELWLRDVDALRAQVKGGPIPVQELVAATERENH
jgi:plasmid stability protein